MRNAVTGRGRLVLATLVATACFGWAAVWSQAEEGASGEVSIEGRVEVAEYDGDGNTVAVYVYDATYGDVLISRQARGRELLRLVGAVVEASGALSPQDEEAEYEYVMTVTSYRVIEPVKGPEDDYPER